MFRSRPRPISVFFIFALFLLATSILAATPAAASGDDDLDDLDELLAIDEELEREKGSAPPQAAAPETDILSRAQKIVVELGKGDVKELINRNEYVFVLGYAPWCERSAELMPRFAEAANTLRKYGSPVVMAKIDAERYRKGATSLGITGLPTMVLFANGTSRPYKGGFTAEEIVIWIKKKTGSPVITLHSAASANDFLAKYHTFVVGLFNNYEGPEYEEFFKAATNDNEFQFVATDNVDVAEVLYPGLHRKTQFLGLVKSEPERYLLFDDVLEEQNILHFVEYNKFPLLTTLTELNSPKFYSSQIKLQVFIIAKSSDFNHLLPLLQGIARKYKTKVLFAFVDSEEDNLAKPFLTLFGVEPEKPVVIAFDNNDGSKYLLESDITQNNFDKFCSKLLNGTLEPYFRSEQIPESKELVQKVVGKTFDKLVLESSKDVFLEIHTPWCMDCEATSKVVESLAKHFRSQDNLLVARMDASMNEHPKLQVNVYPTLLFYPVNDKSNPIKISKKSSLNDLISFVERHRSLPNSNEEKPNKDEL